MTFIRCNGCIPKKHIIRNVYGKVAVTVAAKESIAHEATRFY